VSVAIAKSVEVRDAESEPSRGASPRAILIGLGTVVFINLWVTYSETVVHASRLNLSFFQLTLFAVFIVLLVVVNPLLRSVGTGLALEPGELLSIVAIGMVGSVVPGSGVTGFLIGVISTPVYFATPENGWAEFYHPHFKPWVVPVDLIALRGFYEGIPVGTAVPWSVWVIPLTWWASLLAAVFGASATVMIILRKQWSDHEKLVYPLVAVPVELAGSALGGRLVPELFRSRLFLAAASVPFAMLAWNSLTWSYPLLPSINIFPHAGSFNFTRFSPNIYLEPFNFLTIGFAYFANTQVLFSVWFFFLMHIVEGTIFNRLGYQIAESTDSFSADPPTEAYQCFGALACLVVWRLWVSRRHLRDVFGKAWDSSHPADDSDEILSYRTAVITLGLSLVYAVFWLYQTGMDLVTVMVFLSAVGVIYIGMARIVCEAGVVYSGATITPQAFTMDVRGGGAMSGRTLTSIAITYSLVDYMRGLFAPGVANSVKLGDTIGKGRRSLMLWTCVSVIVGLAASVWYTLHLGYSHGAYNFPRFPFFSGDPKGIFASTLIQMRTPKAFDSERLVFLTIGAGLMGLITFFRYRFAWWPLNPIGMTLASADNTKHLVLPVFITWLAKTILMSVGGVRLYTQAKPAFLGLLVGYVAGVVWCFVVDTLLWPGQGHLVHYW
jgi:hypothetical protein